ncbi:MAG: histidinol-phosphate transaminase [Bdellovibrionaceae bacterium]|nr:histidinol-phosphate transaminase [Pseudobdellovibrionaceae bacterium]|tara:strand:- start:945 stop:2039 length:1095 start_codon:yes stop_codon:yes gene_type:complete
MQVPEYIKSLKPYQPGKPIEETQREYGLEHVCKLASNESPVGVSPQVVAALEKGIHELHRYPDASFYNLKKSFSDYYSIDSQFLTFGNGSNELIDLLIRVYAIENPKILTSRSAFIAYKICAQAAGAQTIESPLDENLRMDLDQIYADYQKHKPSLIFLPNPNNPTGTYLSSEKITSFLDKMSSESDVKIVIDEAYNEYVRAEDYGNSIDYFKKYKNVLVIRTFSKIFGLAGLRLGALVADEETVDFVNRIRNPFNVNSLAQVAAIAVMQDKAYLDSARRLNGEGLDYFYKQLGELGIPFWESQANFVLFDCGQPAGEVYEALLKKGVILRPVAGYGLPNALRMSVGLPEENELAIAAIRQVLE